MEVWTMEVGYEFDPRGLCFSVWLFIVTNIQTNIGIQILNLKVLSIHHSPYDIFPSL
jgi:hypothetical protein